MRVDDLILPRIRTKSFDRPDDAKDNPHREPDAAAEPAPKRRGRPPRRDYSIADTLLAVHMAGAGAAASQIAIAIESTPERVHALLDNHGFGLLPKNASEQGFALAVKRSAYGELMALARDRGGCPKALAAAVLNVVCSEPTLLRNLIDELPGWEPQTAA